MASLTPRRQRGLGYSLFFLPGSIVGAIAPIIAGTLAQSLGYITIFNLGLLVNFAALATLRFAVKTQ
jgi:dipeptide/tripeptide permease